MPVDKRQYESPKLIWYGDLESLTRHGPDKCDDDHWLEKNAEIAAVSPFNCILP